MEIAGNTVYTLVELKERLAEQCDEILLCELLKITPEDLVEAFSDRIEANFTRLMKEIE